MAGPMDILNSYLALPLIPTLLALAGGYLLGSIPFGLVIAKMAGLGDIRNIGSGNIGATNALRTGKKWVALLTLIGDVGKGVAAVLLARAVLHPEVGVLAGVAAFLGHLYPVWLGFKGGKGVATYLGIAAAVLLPVGIGASLVWLVTFLLFRFSSLASLNAALLAPIFAAGMGQGRLVAPLAILSALIFWRHKANIKRLANGTEPKVTKGKTKQP